MAGANLGKRLLLKRKIIKVDISLLAFGFVYFLGNVLVFDNEILRDLGNE